MFYLNILNLKQDRVQRIQDHYETRNVLLIWGTIQEVPFALSVLLLTSTITVATTPNMSFLVPYFTLILDPGSSVFRYCIPPIFVLVQYLYSKHVVIVPKYSCRTGLRTERDPRRSHWISFSYLSALLVGHLFTEGSSRHFWNKDEVQRRVLPSH